MVLMDPASDRILSRVVPVAFTTVRFEYLQSFLNWEKNVASASVAQTKSIEGLASTLFFFLIVISVVLLCLVLEVEVTFDRQSSEDTLEVAFVDSLLSLHALVVCKGCVDSRAFLTLLCKPDGILSHEILLEKGWVAVHHNKLGLGVIGMEDLHDMGQHIWMEKLAEVIDDDGLFRRESSKKETAMRISLLRERDSFMKVWP